MRWLFSLAYVGVYSPDPVALMSLIESNIKDNTTSNATQDSSNTYTGRRRLLATGTFNGTTFSGIKNPIVCLENGAFMLWAVDNTNYPIYDRFVWHFICYIQFLT